MNYYYHDIDPIFVSIGPLSIYWYGLMYVIGIMFAWWLLGRRSRAFHAGTYTGWNTGLNEQQISDIIFYGALSLLIGGRLGSLLFYNTAAFLADPLMLFSLQNGGMSFHGGLLGVVIGLTLYARIKSIPWRDVADIVASVTPLGLLFGRIGNFINGELWGKPTELPWAVIFEQTGGGPLPRHPSMLYEGILEGLVLFVILWWLSSKSYRRGAIFGWFLVLYGIFRFAVEFVRVPDAHLGYQLWGWVTQGQILTVPMLIAGVYLLVTAPSVPTAKKRIFPPNDQTETAS